MKKPELLAPAGDREKLEIALRYGADAVYLGGEAFSLRANARNFSDRGLADAVAYAHAWGKRAYAAVNIFARNADFPALEKYLRQLAEIGTDAVIVSDPGVLELCRRVAPALDIHLSTQANATNGYAAAFWARQGVKRIILARETALADIAQIRADLPPEAELEAFVHGAMCVSYSGRCLLSDALTGRSANRGDCAQPCRWEYEIREKNRGDAYLTLGVEDGGSYLLNSRDLNMIRYVPQLAESGVASFKIEGRMKSVYYVASATAAYRMAIDDWAAGRPLAEEAALETEKCPHRVYSTGFYFPGTPTEETGSSRPQSAYEFVALVKGRDKQGYALVEQRNRFRRGETLEVLSPDRSRLNAVFTVDEMSDERGEAVEDAKGVCQLLRLRADVPLAEGDILRRKRAI